MVGYKRKVQNVIVEPSPIGSSISNHSNSIDRRTKALRSCSNWNSALLHGRRIRGPQWDYATATYHVAKGSPEYFKGVTRIQSIDSNPTTSSNPLSASNHYGPGSSSQFPTGLQPRTALNPQAPQQHHSFQHESDQFPNRPTRPSSHHSHSSSHGRLIGNPTQGAVYPVHPAHLQPGGNQVGIPTQAFNHHPNPPIISPNLPDTKPTLLTNQVPNVASSPHFQPVVPPPGGHGIARHMSTTPSLPASQSERTGETMISHSAPYHNPNPLPNQQTIERPHSSQLAPTPQSFSPAQPHLLPSFDKASAELATSPARSQSHESPAPHSVEPQIATSARKLYPIPSPSLHAFSQRPVTPGSAQHLNPGSGPTNPAQVFQPMHVVYPPNGNSSVPISSQVRNSHYNNFQQPNPNHLKPPGQQILQASMASQPQLLNDPNQFNTPAQFSLQSQLSGNSHLINNSTYPTLMNNPTVNRPIAHNLPPSQFYPNMALSNSPNTAYTNPSQQAPTS